MRHLAAVSVLHDLKLRLESLLPRRAAVCGGVWSSAVPSEIPNHSRRSRIAALSRLKTVCVTSRLNFMSQDGFWRGAVFCHPPWNPGSRDHLLLLHHIRYPFSTTRGCDLRVSCHGVRPCLTLRGSKRLFAKLYHTRCSFPTTRLETAMYGVGRRILGMDMGKHRQEGVSRCSISRRPPG